MTHPAYPFAGMKLGRDPVRHDARTLQLAHFIDDAALPPIPSSHTPPYITWPMYGNDRKGDCTCAAAGHMVQNWTATAGALRTPLDADVERFYIPVTGNEDDGRVEIDVLNSWRHVGFGGDKIVAYAQIDPKNHAHLKAAIYLFGGVYVGIGLPRTAQNQHSEWTVVGHGPDSEAGSWGGHAVPYVGYNSAALTCVTWGALMKLSYGFNDAYTDEAYAVISHDWLNANSQQAPSGLNLAALLASLPSVSS